MLGGSIQTLFLALVTDAVGPDRWGAAEFTLLVAEAEARLRGNCDNWKKAMIVWKAKISSCEGRLRNWSEKITV